MKAQQVIRTIRECECDARDGAPHVQIVFALPTGSRGATEGWPICIGATEAEYTARSIAECVAAIYARLDAFDAIDVSDQ